MERYTVEEYGQPYTTPPTYCVVDKLQCRLVVEGETMAICERICNRLNGADHATEYGECEEVADAILKSQSVI